MADPATQGIPYSVEELIAASEQPLDEYHRELMQWAAHEIIRLRTRWEALKAWNASALDLVCYERINDEIARLEREG